MSRLLRIFGLTAFVPGVVAGAAILLAPHWSVIAVALLALVVIRAAGFGAASYAYLKPGSDLGQALRYGLRRAPGLSAWMLVGASMVGLAGAVSVVCAGRSGLLAAVGTLGLGYAWLATALIGPAYLFERGNPHRGFAGNRQHREFAKRNHTTRPLGRSLHLLHGAFGRVAWRVGRAGLVALAGVALVAWVAWTSTPLTAVLLGAALDVPISMFVFREILATYVERREAEWGGPLALDGAEC